VKPVVAAMVFAVVGCAGPARDPVPARPLLVDAGGDAAAVDAPVDAPGEASPAPHWLRGTTHVHAAPSGDSSTAPDVVFAWYRAHHYDFIILTDHNRVTIPGVDPGARIAANPSDGPLVLAGIELTYNPPSCADPAPPLDGKCRIHVNALGVTGRPTGKVAWADRVATARVDMYRAAIAEAQSLGGVVQINHPQWHWGMTPELLIAIARDGAALVEIANAQFGHWNPGDDQHPSTVALWDAALVAGARLWGVASDDAHAYDGHGKYPPGGAWVMVDAALDGDAIMAALAAGHFYATTGVTLRRAGPVGATLVVEIDGDATGHHTEFVVDGVVVGSSDAAVTRWPIPAAPSYVRAVVTRADGAQAWVQPARR
jgi:hypothetical protein